MRPATAHALMELVGMIDQVYIGRVCSAGHDAAIDLVKICRGIGVPFDLDQISA